LPTARQEKIFAAGLSVFDEEDLSATGINTGYAMADRRPNT
jgi:hypothetical protein